jgi:hypothetical protein
VWDAEGAVPFRREGGDAGAVDAVAGTLVGASIEVPAVRLREWLTDGAPVDLLKLDIEGAELAVLRDIAACLSRVSRLVVEVHDFDPAKRTLVDVLELLTGAGFEYAIDDFLAASWREPVLPADGPFPNQPLCWMLTVKAWRGSTRQEGRPMGRPSNRS